MSQDLDSPFLLWARKHYGRLGALRISRETLQGLLEQRFGTLPVEVIHRIATAKSLDRLNASILDVLDMKSLDDFKL